MLMTMECKSRTEINMDVLPVDKFSYEYKCYIIDTEAFNPPFTFVLKTIYCITIHLYLPLINSRRNTSEGELNYHSFRASCQITYDVLIKFYDDDDDEFFFITLSRASPLLRLV